MARMHVLQASGNNVYSIVVHAPTPAGNNSAAISWATALQNSGLATTQLVVGNGPGQITNAESNQVLAGTLIEANFQWEDNPTWTNQQRLDDLNLRASQAVAAVTADYQARLKYFGHTVA
jgi:hypothetical protein